MKKIIFVSNNMKLDSYYDFLVLNTETIKNLYKKGELNNQGEFIISDVKEESREKSKFLDKVVQQVVTLMKEGKTIILKGNDLFDNFYGILKKEIEFYRYRLYQLDNAEKKYNSKFTKINSLDEALNTIWFDFNMYTKIHHIGDIHGCYTVLNDYLTDLNLPENELFIFTGDFLERGIQNMEVLKLLLAIYKKKNVILLEGNHENYIWQYANDRKIQSKYFVSEIVPLLEKSDIKKSELRQLCRSLNTFISYENGSRRVLVTHGGLTTIPTKIGLLDHTSIVRGTGDYNTLVDSLFTENIQRKEQELQDGYMYYQVHGHRNKYEVPTDNGRSFNLEGSVEEGDFLRTVTLENNSFTVVEKRNTVFNQNIRKHKVSKSTTVTELVESFRENDMISERKTIGDVSSFHFKKEVFYNGLWNSQSNTARGIHIDTKNNKIIARGFDKFFNITEETNLKSKLSFPAYAYEKLNGYLSMAGLYQNDFYLSSKSAINNEHAQWFAQLFHKTFNEDKEKLLKKYMQENDVTLVFETLLPESDPHVITYEKRELVLLNIVKNKVTFETVEWEEVERIANILNIRCAKLYKVINNLEEFKIFIETQQQENIYDLSNKTHLEGFVIKCSNNFMTKIKLPYYLYWKYIRNSVENVLNNPEKKDKLLYLTLHEYKNVESYKILNYALNDYMKNKQEFNLIKFLQDEQLINMVNTFKSSNETFYEKTLNI